MTIAKDFAAKLTVALVAAAMVFSAFAASARAQTTEDLQQMINDLLAQVATLQAQIGGGAAATSVASVCPYTWTRSLSSGTEGMDVMKLQQFLNSDPDTRVAVSGPGSLGAETEYYGPATAAAVSKFQVKYRSEVLSPANLVNPTGFFGPSSIAKANSLCVAQVVEEDVEEAVDNTETPVEEETATLSGEASLDDFRTQSAQDDTIEEGAQDAELATFQVTFTDGDALISRLDVALTNSTAGADAWNAFENVSLWVDGDKVAEQDANSRADYLGDEDNGIIRFSGLDIVAMDDEEVDITVAATIPNGLDTEEQSTWTVGADSLRFFDGEGVATTESGTLVTTDTENFTLEQAGFDDELIVKTSNNDPDATTFELEDNRNSSWEDVFAFDLDTRDSINDISLNQVRVTVTVSSSTFDGLVDDYELVIDGTTITRLADANGTTAGKYTDGATVVLWFDVDNDVVIDAGDRVEATLRLRFNSLAPAFEGTTIQAMVTTSNANNIDADGADTLDTTQLSGSATGDVHTLRTSGIDTTMTASTNEQVVDANSTDDNYGNYTMDIEVTAFGEDAWVPLTADRGASSTVGAAFAIENGSNGSVVASAGTTTESLQLISGGTLEGNYVHLSDGETATVRLTVTYNPATSGQYRVQLLTVGFNDTSATTPNGTDDALPAEDFETSNQSVSS